MSLVDVGSRVLLQFFNVVNHHWPRADRVTQALCVWKQTQNQTRLAKKPKQMVDRMQTQRVASFRRDAIIPSSKFIALEFSYPSLFLPSYRSPTEYEVQKRCFLEVSNG